MPLIDATNLSKTYYSDGVQTKVLHGITLKIEKGEFSAIMGPSGSGKSTLLHVLGFLDRQTEGDYLFDGKKIDEYTDEGLAKVRNRKMGFVFQAFNLLPRTSVLDNVKLPLLYSDIPEREWDKISIEAISSVGLSHRHKHSSSQLSGGEKQRVAIARALVMKPEVIFADEPTGNLDSKSGKAVMEILQTLNETKGHTIVLITHETYTAEHAKRIIKILDGRIESDHKVDHRHLAKEGFNK